METRSEVENRLSEFGIKPSLQRIAILAYLMEHFTHPSVDTIFRDLHAVRPTLSKRMLYNTLKLLTEKGVIQTLNIDDDQRFDIDISRHAHFKCKHCDSVYDIPIKDSTSFKIKDPVDFVVMECQVYYKGYCKQCRDVFAQNVVLF